MGTHRLAQICLNGHTITASADANPELTAKFCKKCGSETITACPECHAHIRGYYDIPGVIGGRPYIPPGYCHNCGKPHPWTARILEAATDLVLEAEGLSQPERKMLIETVPDLTVETPKSQIAVSRYQRLVSKVPGLGETLHKLLVDIVAETVKRSLWPT